MKTQPDTSSVGDLDRLFVYGSQNPSGFFNGPTCAEIQGE